MGGLYLAIEIKDLCVWNVCVMCRREYMKKLSDLHSFIACYGLSTQPITVITMVGKCGCMLIDRLPDEVGLPNGAILCDQDEGPLCIECLSDTCERMFGV